MLDIKEATKIVEKNLPTGKIEKVINYRNLYIFQVFVNSPGEYGLDPFYSVDQSTGEFSDFSIITDGDPQEISALFMRASS